MNKAAELSLSGLITETLTSVVTASVLASLAKFEGRSPAQPINATSHWLHGDEAAFIRGTDLAHTGLGFATHHIATSFWAVPFEVWQQKYPAQSNAELARDAIVMSAIAAFVDYCLTLKRLTPGWEHVLSKRSMVGAYAGLAVGLAAGAYISRERVREIGWRSERNCNLTFSRCCVESDLERPSTGIREDRHQP